MNPYLVERLQPFGTTIFAEMSALAVDDRRDQPRAGLSRHRRSRRRQAGRDRRDPGRAQPVSARHRDPRAARRDPCAPATLLRTRLRRRRRVLVTAGATEAIAAALIALCGPGDEVVTFEPYYDSYAACIAMAGATRARRHAAHARLRASTPTSCARRSRRARSSSCSTRRTTRPARCSTGRSSTLIAELAQEHDLLVVTDEVYEHLVYDGEHVPLATLPGMRDRTVTIGSGGKTFSFTGWKVGWVCAPPGAGGRGQDREAVPHLRQQRPVPVRDRGRPAAARRVLHRVPRRDARQARPALRGSGRRRLRRAPAAGHVLRDRRHPLVRRDRRARVLPVAAAPLRSRRGPERRVLRRRRRPARRSCGSPAANAPRCSTRRARD